MSAPSSEWLYFENADPITGTTGRERVSELTYEGHVAMRGTFVIRSVS
jgi:hypothetical protein